MCYVQIAGLLLATLVTLGIVPVVYMSVRGESEADSLGAIGQ